LAGGDLTERLWQEVEPALAGHGYELVELEWQPHGSRSVLRVFVDKTGGVTLDDCQAVSELLGVVLDRADLIEARYVLEVSSPGFDRPVRKPVDFERFAGERVHIRTRTPVQGRKQFTGILSAL